MSKILTTTRLKVEDFKGQKDWIAPMFNIMNRFFAETISAVNGGLVFFENVTGIEKTFEFVHSLNTLPLKFAWVGAAKPQDLIVVSAYQNPNPTTKPKDYTPIKLIPAWFLDDKNQVQIFDLMKLTTYRGSLTSGSTTVSNLTSTDGIISSGSIIQSISGSGVPDSTTISSVNTSARSLVMSAAATASNDDVFLTIGCNSAVMGGLVSGYGYKIKVRGTP